MSGVMPGCAPSHVETQWLAGSFDSFTVAGAAPGSHRFPCFTLSTRVTEHLKQVAKVRGLGVERQLKPPRAQR
ncbi:protein of unknown function [Pseudomonas mediterranea]